MMALRPSKETPENSDEVAVLINIDEPDLSKPPNTVSIQPPKKYATQSIQGISVILVGTIVCGISPIFNRASKQSSMATYRPEAVVLMSEFTKFVLSFIFLIREQNKDVSAAFSRLRSLDRMHWMRWSVPSVIYTICNNLDWLILEYMDPATFQIMIQIKVLTTSILWWYVFATPISKRGWASLVLLFIGSVIVGIPSATSTLTTTTTTTPTGNRMEIKSPIGILIICIQACLSASAGIYTEWTYKKLGVDRSLHEDNLGMYLWGMISNGLRFVYVVGMSGNVVGLGDLFGGFGSNVWIYCLIMSYSSYGLIVSQVMKYFSSLVKLFMVGASIVVSGFLTYFWFGIVPTWNYVFGGGLVLVSVVMFKTS